MGSLESPTGAERHGKTQASPEGHRQGGARVETDGQARHSGRSDLSGGVRDGHLPELQSPWPTREAHGVWRLGLAETAPRLVDPRGQLHRSMSEVLLRRDMSSKEVLGPKETAQWFESVIEDCLVPNTDKILEI